MLQITPNLPFLYIADAYICVFSLALSIFWYFNIIENVRKH
jgi:hypothetical protein